MRYRAEVVDRRFLDYHYCLPRAWSFMDLDGLPFCPRCWYPIALIETTTNPDKKPAVLRRLSLLTNLPAYVLLLPPLDDAPTFEDIAEFRWRVVGPGPEIHTWNRGPLEDWRTEELMLRNAHVCVKRLGDFGG